MDQTKLLPIIAALAVSIVSGIAIFAGSTNDVTLTPDARSAAAASYDSAPLHTELGGEVVGPGADSQTGVTLPTGSTLVGVFLTGSAAGAFDVTAVELDNALDDSGAVAGVWLLATVHNHAATPLRFTAEVGYSTLAPIDAGAP